jgi:hypothetical protein
VKGEERRAAAGWKITTHIYNYRNKNEWREGTRRRRQKHIHPAAQQEQQQQEGAVISLELKTPPSAGN